jgi:hypothetical protein
LGAVCARPLELHTQIFGAHCETGLTAQVRFETKQVTRILDRWKIRQDAKFRRAVADNRNKALAGEGFDTSKLSVPKKVKLADLEGQMLAETPSRTLVHGSIALTVVLAAGGIWSAQVVVKQEPLDLRNGATVLVDDGTCGKA